MLQITCKCGREMELIHPTQSGMVICSGCLAQVSVPGKGGRREMPIPVLPSEEWVTCRKCRNSFPGPTQFVGRMMRCPVCGKRVWMPNFKRKFWKEAPSEYQPDGPPLPNGCLPVLAVLLAILTVVLIIFFIGIFFLSVFFRN